MDKLEKIAKEFICELNLFEYQFTGFDKVWNVIFDVSTRKWLHINVVKYQDKYYLNELLHNYPTLEIDSKKDFEIENSKSNNFNSFHNLPIDSWGFVLEAAISHLKLVQKNWVETL